MIRVYEKQRVPEFRIVGVGAHIPNIQECPSNTNTAIGFRYEQPSRLLTTLLCNVRNLVEV